MTKNKKNATNAFADLFRENDLYLSAVLFLAAFLTRFGIMALSDNFKGPQPMLNIITSLHLFKDPGFMQNINYQQLPFFLYSLFAAVKIGEDQIIPGRMLSVFWGSLSVAVFYYLVSRMHGKKIGAFSALLLCFYPAHVVLSVLSVPDMIGLVFMLVALYFVKAQNFLFSALCVCLSTASTYVSWVFLLILPVFAAALEERKNLGLTSNKAVKIFLGSGLFAFFWIIVTAHVYPEHGIFYKNFFQANTFFEYLFAFMQNVSKTIGVFVFELTPFLLALGSIGIIEGLRTRRNCELFFLICALILGVSSGIFRSEIQVVESGVLLIGVLFLPYVSLGIQLVFRVFKLVKIKYPAIALMLICFNLLSLALETRPYLPREVKKISCWLKDNISNQEAINISVDHKGYFTSIIMLSNLPQGNFHLLTDRKLKKDAAPGIYIIAKNRAEYFSCDRNEELMCTENFLIYGKRGPE